MKFVAIINNQQTRLTGESARNQGATCAVLGGVCFDTEVEAHNMGRSYTDDKYMVFPYSPDCECLYYPKFVTIKNGIAICDHE